MPEYTPNLLHRCCGFLYTENVPGQVWEVPLVSFARLRPVLLYARQFQTCISLQCLGNTFHSQRSRQTKAAMSIDQFRANRNRPACRGIS